MVYRVDARAIAAIPADPDSDGTLVRFDASGRPGRAGADGYPGAHGGHAGADGSRGGDAGSAERGQDGGTLLVELRPGPSDDVVAIEGDRRLADGRASSFREAVSFATPGFVDLLAPGGRGGDGGDGGRGGAGATGTRGSNATRYRSGGDGGRGGDGGDGGHASSGADGGAGGRIVVEVDEAHTHLLMLVRQNVTGAPGGEPGTNGAGGSAGSGGAGGSSYHWTETESYTDAEGNRRTRTRFRSNPGGSQGPSGYPGRPGNAVVVPGRPGRDGSFCIVVPGPDGDHEYPSRYEVRLRAFAHESENADGVYEPGERVRAFGIEVENIGGMPTPSHSDVEIRLEQEGWIVPEDARLRLPRGLSPGERCRLDEPLWMTIGDYRPHGPDDPLRVPQCLRLRADLPAVQREFVAFDDEVADALGPFVIAFPAEASPLESLHALAPGEAARMRFSLTNRSGLELGAASATGRRLRFTLRAQDSEIGDVEALLLDDRGERVPLDEGWTVEIDRFAPGQTRDFEVTIGFFEDAPLYRSLTLWLTVELGFLDRPAELRPIQHRAFEARVASRYRRDLAAEVLLVVNHRTTREELDAWHRLLEGLGLSPAIWDLSLQGGLDLQAPQADGERLLDHFAGASMIVIDNEVITPAGPSPAHRVIGKENLIAAAEAGIDVLFVGVGADVQALLTPTLARAEDHAEEVEASPLAELRAQLARTEPRALEEVTARAAVHDWDLLRRGPSAKPLVAAAEALASSLAARHPGLRFAVVHRYAPVEVDRLLWAKRWRLGHLEVRAMIPTRAGRLLSVELPDHELHDPARVEGDDTRLAVLLTRSFAEKLQLLEVALRRAATRFMTSDKPSNPRARQRADLPENDRDPATLVGLIVDALLVDLAEEIRAVIAPGWRAGLGYAALEDALPRLRALAEFRPVGGARLPPGSAAGEQIARLVATARRLAYAHFHVWEWLPPFALLRRAPAVWWLVRRLTGDFLRGVFGGPDPSSPDAIAARDWKEGRKYVDVASRALEAGFETFRKEEGGDDRAAWQIRHVEAMIFAPLERRGVTSDAEVYATWRERVLAGRAMREAEERDAALAEGRARAEALASEARATLLCEAATEDLIPPGAATPGR